ncbi:hypothetical protein [Streptosporangium sp. NPDC049644]|uniref:hypothetical protein n=1 Tax=Streptosporangium sp. NPDC049644 TaxID=3155507 RepID=UPI0034481CBB
MLTEGENIVLPLELDRVNSLSVMLLLFAGVVLFVSVLVIANTFSMVDVHTATGLVGLALAALLLVIGPALLGVAVIQDSTALMPVGGGSVFTGVCHDIPAQARFGGSSQTP